MLGTESHPDDSRKQQCFRHCEYDWMFKEYAQLPMESFSQDSTTTTPGIDEPVVIDSSEGDLAAIKPTTNSNLICISSVPQSPIITRSAYTETSTSHESADINKRTVVCFAEPLIASVAYTHWNDDDVRHSWYHNHDYESFEHDTRLTVLALQHARGDLRKLDPRQYTVSGLEKNLTRDQMYHRRLQTARHVQTVLDAQRQSDAEQLKAISEMLSKQTMLRAHLRAALDQTLLYY